MAEEIALDQAAVGAFPAAFWAFIMVFVVLRPVAVLSAIARRRERGDWVIPLGMEAS
jgi:hypothetical protein